jgi:hypothetical protein
LFNVNIGEGTVSAGTFAGIDWSNGAKFMQVELDPQGGNAFIDMGTQQMLSVPYALYAEKSGSSTTTITGTYVAGYGIAINNDTISIQTSANQDPSSNSVRYGFNTSSFWTCPSGINQVTVELWGAGGTSGGGSTLCDQFLGNTCFGGVGGKGGYNKQTVSVTPGQSYEIIVGMVNGGGTDNICRMPNGGSSSFNNIFFAPGGQGGRVGMGCCSCGSEILPGYDGSVTNYTHPSTQLIVPTSYIPQSYITNYYPISSAPANTNGFVIISY